ncbi:DUF4864 domain-containing protein [Salinirubellus sp. GCM10025818]|uniref:DUF4864 domain-containing protein n=1 Tax=Salinirubellus TaxID=2162630 RepID=UPI0030D2201F
MARSPWSVLLVAVVVALAGCGSVISPTTSTTETPLTPVTVPTDSPTAEPTESTATRTPASPVPEPRYLRLRPTCERPPGLVVAIQVGALRNNPPGSREGFNTAWQFAAPGNRRAIGSFARFVDVVERGYGPLLDAEAVTIGPVGREESIASLRVTVRNGNRTTAYRWRLQRQSDGPLEGCWLSTGVVGVEGESTPTSGRPTVGLLR